MLIIIGKHGFEQFTRKAPETSPITPRASINLALASKAYAFIKRRGYVIPEDVRNICKDVLRHRIGLTYEAEAENVNVENIMRIPSKNFFIVYNL